MVVEVAYFGMGCFWGAEHVFSRVDGVLSTAVGYMGGDYENPTYKDVCTGKTGHAEVVKVLYDPDRVSYEKLLKVFWENHDPTTLNRQGPDVGSQYRSVIFYHTPAEGSCIEYEGTAREVGLVQKTCSNRDFSCIKVLQGRGVPPEVLRKALIQQL